jgi:hypothetical protein
VDEEDEGYAVLICCKSFGNLRHGRASRTFDDWLHLNSELVQ